MGVVLAVLTRWLRALLDVARRFLPVLFPPLLRPRVSSFSPGHGWPGTKVTIRGSRFAPDRDGNVVSIGGDRALVVTASATELVVIAGERTVTGRVDVQTSEGTGSSATDFVVLPLPDVPDVATAGLPMAPSPP